MTIGYNSDVSPDAYRTRNPVFRKTLKGRAEVRAALAKEGGEAALLTDRKLYEQAEPVFAELAQAFRGLRLSRAPVQTWEDHGVAYAEQKRFSLRTPEGRVVVEATLDCQFDPAAREVAGIEVVVHRGAARRHGAGSKKGDAAVRAYTDTVKRIFVSGIDVLCPKYLGEETNFRDKS